MKILLIGRSKTAKTWVSRYLVEHFGFYEKGLGDGVLKMVRVFYPYEDFKRIPWEKKLQFYDSLYKVDSNIWINYLKIRMSTVPDTSNIVVDDARYLNEVQQLKNMGFTLVRITAPYSRAHQFHSLLDAAPGALSVNEAYAPDFTNLVGVEYSIHIDAPNYGFKMLREGNKNLDRLIEKLDNSKVLV